MAIGTTLKVSFDGSAVQRGLAGFKNTFKSIGSGVGSAAKLTGGLTALGLAGGAAVAAVAVNINSIGESARASDARVQNIVKSMGLFGDRSDEVTERLLNFADTQGRLLGVDDDIIASTEAKLLTFKELAKSADVAGGAFDRATMAAIDMAKAGFGEAEQNAVQLGKALNDPVKGINSLTKSGITFTKSQKEMIATMVRMGELGKAQNVVLSSIESQVGGTAAATATASDRIKVSLSQIVEEFAKPFSTGFDGLPGSMESVFPKIMEKAGELGSLVSNAIKDAISGNLEKFAAIGSIIGEAIKVGLKTAMMSAGGSVGKWMLDSAGKLPDWMPLSMIGKAGSKAAGDPASTGELLEANIINSNLGKMAEAIGKGTQGLVPGTNGAFRYANPGETSSLNDGNGNKVVEVLLKNIEKNTQSGAKM